MKNPIAIAFNDMHIQTGNEEAILKAVDFMFSYAKKNKIKNLILAGDVFERRAFLRLSEIKVFEKILEKAYLNDMVIDAIPGNHDKTVYSEKDSFLDSFQHFPNFFLHRYSDKKNIGGLEFSFIPFFSDDVLVPLLVESEGGDILISHFEMKGSVNLGMVSEKNTITKRLLKKWKKVYLGHFHDNHDISENISHLPALRQNNFGEDTNKGFSVIYDDGSYSVVRGVFKAFVVLSLDIDTITLNEIESLIEEHKNSQDTVRFELHGNEHKLKALDSKMFEGTGIDVKKKFKNIVVDDSQPKPKVIKKYNKNDVEEMFKSFCEEKNLEHKEGERYLKEFFKNKEAV